MTTDIDRSWLGLLLYVPNEPRNHNPIVLKLTEYKKAVAVQNLPIYSDARKQENPYNRPLFFSI